MTIMAESDFLRIYQKLKSTPLENPGIYGGDDKKIHLRPPYRRQEGWV